MKRAQPEPIELHMTDLDDIIKRSAEGPLNDDDRAKLRAAFEALFSVSGELAKKRASVARMR